MDIALCPDTYVPAVNEEGVYIDSLPPSIPNSGIKCPCFERFYTSREKLSQHFKCKRHEIWLKNINLDNKNFFKKCMEYKEIIRQQRLLIARLEQKDVRTDNLIDL